MTLYDLAEQGHTVYVTILPPQKRCGTPPVRVHLNCHQTGMGNTIEEAIDDLGEIDETHLPKRAA